MDTIDPLYNRSRMSAPLHTDGWRPRSGSALRKARRDALDAWRLKHAERVARWSATPPTRDARLESAWRLESLEREAWGVQNRVTAMGANLVQHGETRPRAVIVHRQEWFVARIAEGLESCSVQVVDRLDDGADAVAAVVVHQPDLLIIGDLLPRVTGEQVLRTTLELAPATVVAVQASAAADIGRLLDAGANLAESRQVPPAAIVRNALAYLGQPRG